MELYHLRTFIKVADAGNLTRASALLHTSQPAISAQIKALEEELEVKLFVRSARGMALTATGKQLYVDAESTLAAADKLKQRAQSLRHQLVGDIKVAIHSDLDYLRVAQIFDEMRERYPQIQLHIRQSSSASVLAELRCGEVDLGFMYGDCHAADILWQHLKTVQMGLVLPLQYAELAAAPITKLCELPWIYTTPNCPFYKISEVLFEQSGSRPRSIAWVDTEEGVRSLAASGAGVAMMRLDDAEKFEAEGKAVAWRGGKVETLPMASVCLAKRAQEPALSALMDQVEGIFAVEPEALRKSG